METIQEVQMESFYNYVTKLSIDDLIVKTLDTNEPFSVALILYKLNHEKYYCKNFVRNIWIDKSSTTLTTKEILSELKESITTIIRNNFVEYNKKLTNENDIKNCMFIIEQLLNPKYINDIIRESREMFYYDEK